MNGNFNVENRNTDAEWSCQCGCRCIGIFDYNTLIGLEVIKDGFVQSVIIEDDTEAVINSLDAGACPICDHWEDGRGRAVYPEAFGERVIDATLIIETPRGLRQLDLNDYYKDDIWQAIDAYDEHNKTNFWSLIEPDMIIPGYYAVELPLPDLTKEDFAE